VYLDTAFSPLSTSESLTFHRASLGFPQPVSLIECVLRRESRGNPKRSCAALTAAMSFGAAGLHGWLPHLNPVAFTMSETSIVVRAVLQETVPQLKSPPSAPGPLDASDLRV
jgi:hypothetical protein